MRQLSTLFPGTGSTWLSGPDLFRSPTRTTPTWGEEMKRHKGLEEWLHAIFARRGWNWGEEIALIFVLDLLTKSWLKAKRKGQASSRNGSFITFTFRVKCEPPFGETRIHVFRALLSLSFALLISSLFPLVVWLTVCTNSSNQGKRETSAYGSRLFRLLSIQLASTCLAFFLTASAESRMRRIIPKWGANKH